MPEANAPDVGTLFKVCPVATIPMLRFELESQWPRIVIRDQLQGAGFIQMLEKLENEGVADARLDCANIKDAFFDVFGEIVHHTYALISHLSSSARRQLKRYI